MSERPAVYRVHRANVIHVVGSWGRHAPTRLEPVPAPYLISPPRSKADDQPVQLELALQSDAAEIGLSQR